MPLQIIRNDITRMAVDAIVNPTNEKMLPDGGVDAAVHKAAGDALAAECQRLGFLKPGHVVLTAGYALPCRYIIHTVGPRWYDGLRSEEAVLRQCYREALTQAKDKGCESIAFPLVAAGSFGFPAKEAMHIASTEIQRFLKKEDMTVYLVVYDEASYRLGKDQFPNIQAYIDSHYIKERQEAEPTRPDRSGFYRPSFHSSAPKSRRSESAMVPESTAPDAAFDCPAPMAAAPHSHHDAALKETVSRRNDLAEILRQMDESFSETLFRLIDEKGLTDAQCYKKANIDRKLFSKIRNPHYKPSKPTILALAIALELSLPETSSLLQKAGFALSHSSKFDVIVEYCILNRIYNVFDVNEILFSYDQNLLGSMN